MAELTPDGRQGRAAHGPRRELSDLAVLTVVVLASAAYVLWHLRRGLIPHDDGAIGHAAERVLLGELPHRDFDDIYTGGLAWLNALGFTLLGPSLLTMRLVLLGAFLAWLPAQYYVARRFVGPLAAGAVTLLAAAWSVPNYPAPMPSWYNLFLATVGVAALMRWIEGREARWLVVAGVAGGLSVLMKVIGLYYIAGALLFLVHEAHARSRAAAGARPARGGSYLALILASLALFVAGLVALVSRRASPPELVHFVVPGALVAALVAYDEVRSPAGCSASRLRVLARLLGPFLLGVGLPLAVFILPYVRSESVGVLLHGVFILPTLRFGSATFPMLPLASMAAVVPFVALVAAGRRWPDAARAPTLGALGAALLLLVWLAGEHPGAYRFTWSSLRNIVPVLTMIAVVLLARPRVESPDGDLRRSQLVLLLAVTALCSLVQFPFSVPIYFCYVAPLALLLATALNAWLPPRGRGVPELLGAFYFAFAVTRVNTSSLGQMGFRHVPYPETVRLDLARGGVSLAEYNREEFVAVARLLERHARGGYTWASPDCPEIYFLTGLRNPTRTLFEFFDDPTGQNERVLAALEARGVTAIVLHRWPEFSKPLDIGLHGELVRRYPRATNVGRFQVRWR